MLYPVLKTLHVLAIIVWVGGMAFTLFFWRPAVAVLEPPIRLRLMLDILGRFFWRRSGHGDGDTGHGRLDDG